MKIVANVTFAMNNFMESYNGNSKRNKASPIFTNGDLARNPRFSSCSVKYSIVLGSLFLAQLFQQFFHCSLPFLQVAGAAEKLQIANIVVSSSGNRAVVVNVHVFLARRMPASQTLPVLLSEQVAKRLLSLFGGQHFPLTLRRFALDVYLPQPIFRTFVQFV